MKRAPVHFVFAAVALACAAVAAYDWMHLQRAQHINQAMAEAAVETVQTAEKADKPGSANARGSERSADDARELKLAHAIALSKAGAYDAAGSLFEDLIRDPHLDEVGRAALFDLGNLYLREGMGNTQTGTVRSAPMIEEAKARYRTLLRAAPDDWDARYNLERALWLAPETRSAPQSPEVKNQHNVQVVDPATRDLP